MITGEGRIDAQTAFGKTALGVARLAEAVTRPVHRGRRRCRARRDRRARTVRRPGRARLGAPGCGRRGDGRRSGAVVRLRTAARKGGCLMAPMSPEPGPAPEPATAPRRGKVSASKATATGRKPATKRKKRRAPDPGSDVGPTPRTNSAEPRRRRPRRACHDPRPSRMGASPRPDQRTDPHDPHPEQCGHERGAGVRVPPRCLPVGPPRGALMSPARAGAGSGSRMARRPTGPPSSPRRSRSSSM